MRKGGLVFFVLLATAAAQLAPEATAELKSPKVDAAVALPDGFYRDDRGRVMQVSFDLQQRLWLGASYAPRRRLSGKQELSPMAFDFGLTQEWYSDDGEALADFLRSEHPGRWLAVGALGYYDVRLQRQATGPLSRDHRVMPLTAGCAWLHGETDRGLVACGLRAEWGRAWSSQRGWGQAFRAEAELELTPIAVNDLPLSVVLSGTVELGRHTPDDRARYRAFAGVRLGAPLSVE